MALLFFFFFSNRTSLCKSIVQLLRIYRTRALNKHYSERIGGVYKPGEASQVMLDVLALSNSSMVERR